MQNNYHNNRNYHSSSSYTLDTRKIYLIISIALSGLAFLGGIVGCSVSCTSDSYATAAGASGFSVLAFYSCVLIWSGFGFGCLVENLSLRKGYPTKFVWGFWFSLVALLYWGFVPAGWDHPEYIRKRRPVAPQFVRRPSPQPYKEYDEYVDVDSPRG